MNPTETTPDPITYACTGDVQSNPETIAALRQGVEIERRITVLELDGVSIPLVTSETEGAIAIEVAADVLAEIAARQPGPRRRSGQVDLGSIDSLIDYVNRFGRAGGAKDGDPGGAVAFAPVNPPGITAILDYHPAGRGTTAWCEERATYRAQFSRQWLTWTGHEGKPLGQVPFGDFIEANQRDLRSGAEGYASATTMIQVARNLVINSAGKFQRTVNPTTGEGTLVVKDEHDAATSTKIPSTFALAIPVFEGDAELYPVEALLRFTMANGTPQFAFLLQNKAEVLEFALAGLRTKVAEGCGIPVFVGNPPPAAR